MEPKPCDLFEFETLPRCILRSTLQVRRTWRLSRTSFRRQRHQSEEGHMNDEIRQMIYQLGSIQFHTTAPVFYYLDILQGSACPYKWQT